MMPILRRLTLLIFLVMVPAVLGQGKKDPLRANYILFKVSDLSIDEDRNRIGTFLDDNFGLGAILESYTLDFPSLAYRFMDGWEFHKYALLEAELIYYDEYDINIKTTDGDAFSLNRQSYAAGFSVAGRYPLLKNLYVYGKGGISYWRSDTKRRGGQDPDLPKKFHEDDINLTLGGGLRWSITESILVDLSLEKTEVDGLDVDTITFGLGFRY